MKILKFFLGIIRAFTPSFHFTYLSTTFTSVRMRGKRFMGAGLLILIFSLFFVWIKFYFFCDQQSKEYQKFSNCYIAMITFSYIKYY